MTDPNKLIADLRSAENTRHAIGATDEIAAMYHDQCVSFVFHNWEYLTQLLSQAAARELQQAQEANEEDEEFNLEDFPVPPMYRIREFMPGTWEFEWQDIEQGWVGYGTYYGGPERACMEAWKDYAEDLEQQVLELEPATAATAVNVVATERCESGSLECGPVEFHDSEGVPLCRGCWEALAVDSARYEVGD